jgi:hypothetical protein
VVVNSGKVRRVEKLECPLVSLKEERALFSIESQASPTHFACFSRWRTPKVRNLAEPLSLPM